MIRIILVGVGSFIGGITRYLVSGFLARLFGELFPYGTLLVNVLSGFLIGFIMEASIELWPVSSNLRIFLTIGFLGGLSTFSTFSYETVNMLADGSYLIGSINVGLNLFLSLFGVWLGEIIVQNFRGGLL